MRKTSSVVKHAKSRQLAFLLPERASVFVFKTINTIKLHVKKSSTILWESFYAPEILIIDQNACFFFRRQRNLSDPIYDQPEFQGLTPRLSVKSRTSITVRPCLHMFTSISVLEARKTANSISVKLTRTGVIVKDEKGKNSLSNL